MTSSPTHPSSSSSLSTSPHHKSLSDRTSPDVISPIPRRPTSTSLTPSSTSESDEIISDIQIPAIVRVTSLTIFLIQFTIVRGEGKDVEVKTVAKTPEDIRAFARMGKVRGVKVYNRNLKKRSANYVDKKREIICARFPSLSLPLTPSLALSLSPSHSLTRSLSVSLSLSRCHSSDCSNNLAHFLYLTLSHTFFLSG
jgi:hypothetical protein